jgi:lipoprotein-anchoring transpeptidase ErfK/SrfK
MTAAWSNVGVRFVGFSTGAGKLARMGSVLFFKPASRGVNPTRLRIKVRGYGFPSAEESVFPQAVGSSLLRFSMLIFLTALLRAQEPAAVDAPPPPREPERPVETILEAQVELHRRGFSSGSIDGVPGPQTAAALRAFQRGAGIKETGALDRATREILRLSAPALTEHAFSAEELGSLRPLPTTWVGKSEEPRLEYATALELAAERFRASPNFLKKLNPDTDWSALLPGASIKVPAVEQALIMRPAALLNIRLAARELDAFDSEGRVIAHFPVSIAKMAEKRPVGELHVTVVIYEPNYTFDPEVFTESAEARQLGRKLIVPPGPNNPVGLAWIGLDRPGYGIHGTPDPEKVGRTESHGCFRLANWDAITLRDLVRAGTPVVVEP